jgi:hypothetical protein
MRLSTPKRCSIMLVILVTSLLGAGCATNDEWTTWREHPTHFASAGHLGFSVRNREGTTPRVRRQDIATAAGEAWWGKSITVAQEQILER